MGGASGYTHASASTRNQRGRRDSHVHDRRPTRHGCLSQRARSWKAVSESRPSHPARAGRQSLKRLCKNTLFLLLLFLIYKIECREGTRSTRRGISRPGGGSGGAQSSPESRRCPAAGGSESKPGKRDARQDLRQHAPQGVYGHTAQGATPVSAPAAAPAPPPGGGGLTSTRSAGCTSWTGTRPWTWPAPRRAAAAPASAGTSARTPGWGSSGRTPRRSGRC